MQKTLILGDVHLNKGMSLSKAGIGSNINSRLIDQINLLDWVLERATEHLIFNIIITGDIFEEPTPSSNIISIFINWLMKCKNSGIQVHIIAGNHDILRSGNYYYSPLDIITESEIDNIHIYKDIDTVYIDNIAYTLVPFRDRKSFSVEKNSEALEILNHQIEYQLAEIPLTYKKILIGHFAIEGSIHVGDEIDDITNELYCPVKMFNGYDFTWMGHVHKPQVMSKVPYVEHIGSMDASNFLEGNQDKFIIIIDSDHKDYFFKEKIPTRKLKKISINIPADIEDTTEYVKKEISDMKNELDNSIVKVEISLSSSDMKSVDKKKISELLETYGVFNVSGFSETKKLMVIKNQENNIIDNSFDTNSAIKKYSELHVDEKIRSKFLEISLDILSSIK